MSAGRKYLKTHEWVEIQGSLAVIGISEFAQDVFGDITFIDIPKTGTALTQGMEFGVIEAVKAASDLYAPVNGTVAQVNEALITAPELVNNDPLGEGWILKVSGFSGFESADLLDETGYAAFLKTDS